MKNSETNKNKVKYPIGFKLVLIISILIVVSLGTVTFLVSFIVGEDVRNTAEKNNFAIAASIGKTADNELSTVRSNVFLMLDMLNAAGSSGVLSRQTTAYFFERNQNIAAVIIPGSKDLINNRYFTSNELDTGIVEDFLLSHQEEVTSAEQGTSLVLNATPVFDLPMIACFYPWKGSGFDQAVVIFYSADSLSDACGTTGSGSDIYVINHEGDILVHSDFNLVKAGSNVAKMPLVKMMRDDSSDNRQELFKMEDGKEYFGAYSKISIADVSVLAMIEKNTALAVVRRQVLLNSYLALAVLFISVLFIFLYSKTLSNPLKRLTAVANEIKQGNFNTELFDTLSGKKKKAA